MANEISGKVIAVSGVIEVAAKVAGKEPIKMKQLYLDCTRYDPYTGERSQYENTPLLDFRGENMKLLDGLQKGDVVTVTFDVNGYKYEKDGKTQVYTSIRPYRVTKRVKNDAAQAEKKDDMPF